MPFARLNADPRVLEFLPGPLTREASDAVADRIEAHFRQHGFGLWVVEVLGETPFAGFVGLSIPRFEARFMPCVEIGWRLDADYWNRGYATEGARAAASAGRSRATTVPATMSPRRFPRGCNATSRAPIR